MWCSSGLSNFSLNIFVIKLHTFSGICPFYKLHQLQSLERSGNGRQITAAVKFFKLRIVICFVNGEYFRVTLDRSADIKFFCSQVFMFLAKNCKQIMSSNKRIMNCSWRNGQLCKICKKPWPYRLKSLNVREQFKCLEKVPRESDFKGLFGIKNYNVSLLEATSPVG